MFYCELGLDLLAVYMKRKRKSKFHVYKILPFRCIKINIPRKFLIKLYNVDRYLTFNENVKISQKLREIEKVQNKLSHLKSVVERIRLKKSRPD